MSELTSTLSAASGELSPEMRPFARVITAMAKGDFSQQVPLQTPDGTPLQGEVLELARTLNSFVEQLNQFSAGLKQVSHEIGTEHKFGGQIEHSVQGELIHFQEAIQRLAQQQTHPTPEEVFDTDDINPSLKGT